MFTGTVLYIVQRHMRDSASKPLFMLSATRDFHRHWSKIHFHKLWLVSIGTYAMYTDWCVCPTGQQECTCEWMLVPGSDRCMVWLVRTNLCQAYIEYTSRCAFTNPEIFNIEQNTETKNKHFVTLNCIYDSIWARAYYFCFFAMYCVQASPWPRMGERAGPCILRQPGYCSNTVALSSPQTPFNYR